VSQSHSGVPETRKCRYRRTVSDAVHTMPFNVLVKCSSFQRLCTVPIILDPLSKRDASDPGALAPEHCDKDRGETMGFFHREKPREEGPLRLHIGCGQQAIPGWINIDNQALPGVDRVLDVRQGLPFRGVSAIYAEHFLEHIGFEDGLAFLKECRRALADFGVLRISTPNLDWVFATHYNSWPSGSQEERLRDCFQLNQAFHGWGHQFLYNRSTLEAALKSAGFANVVFQEYGKSDIPDLYGIERHETYVDSPELPHVLIAEASGEARQVPLPVEILQNFRVVINER
jgi:predicted SAM-dependent methyltransferase